MRFGPFFFETLYGADQPDGSGWSPYMTRCGLARLRFHLFHRGDVDPDLHNHPWAFITFQLRSYVEQVSLYPVEDVPPGTPIPTKFQIVRAFRFHYRPADHYHRVLGPWTGRYQKHPQQDPHLAMVGTGKIPTLVWAFRKSQHWGFLRLLDGCFIPWRKYIDGSKSAPCQD